MYLNLRIKVPNIIEQIFLFFLLRWRKKHYGFVFRRIRLHNGEYTIVDASDYPMLCKYDWLFKQCKTSDYAWRMEFQNGKQKIIYMHRQIMNHPQGRFIDHINHNSLDNRRDNLRIATPRENRRNCRKVKKATSIYKGVSYRKDLKKYLARIVINGRRINLGQFNSKVEAGRAYDAAVKIYHGQFAVLNFPHVSS